MNTTKTTSDLVDIIRRLLPNAEQERDSLADHAGDGNEECEQFKALADQAIADAYEALAQLPPLPSKVAIVRSPYPVGATGLTAQWFTWCDDDGVEQAMPPGASVKVIAHDERPGCCIVVLEFLNTHITVLWNLVAEPNHVRIDQ